MNNDQTDKPLKTLQEIKTDQIKHMCKHGQEEGLVGQRGCALKEPEIEINIKVVREIKEIGYEAGKPLKKDKNQEVIKKAYQRSYNSRPKGE